MSTLLGGCWQNSPREAYLNFEEEVMVLALLSNLPTSWEVFCTTFTNSSHKVDIGWSYQNDIVGRHQAKINVIIHWRQCKRGMVANSIGMHDPPNRIIPRPATKLTLLNPSQASPLTRRIFDRWDPVQCTRCMDIVTWFRHHVPCDLS